MRTSTVLQKDVLNWNWPLTRIGLVSGHKSCKGKLPPTGACPANHKYWECNNTTKLFFFLCLFIVLSGAAIMAITACTQHAQYYVYCILGLVILKATKNSQKLHEPVVLVQFVVFEKFTGAYLFQIFH